MKPPALPAVVHPIQAYMWRCNYCDRWGVYVTDLGARIHAREHVNTDHKLWKKGLEQNEESGQS
jgi:hypothetical protein